ncbi:MAG: UDP-N-acetylglucosamine 4,6-dehydratase (inverting) [Kiritimatiellia bacterium]
MLGDLSFLEHKRVLITGGTGSLGKKLIRTILDRCQTTVLIVYSRDEFKQYQFCSSLKDTEKKRLRFFLGDVRDLKRLKRAMERVDYVIHAAALKQVPAAEYNPFEFIKTNVIGAENVINACIDSGIRNCVALSTDKAANPINLYGATKLCSDKLFVSGNNYSGIKPARFSVVRYGNVVGSRGSVVPFFLRQRKTGNLPITNYRMTRFWITLEQGAALVLNALRDMVGGEIWVPKIPSMKITDLAKTIAPDCATKEIGIRPGEKLHEVMIPVDDGRYSIEFDDHFVILPQQDFQSAMADQAFYLNKGGTACSDDFVYGSDKNTIWLNEQQLTKMIAQLDLPEAQEWVAERS